MNFQNLNRVIDLFPSNCILCVGDMMLDEYVSGEAHRLSPEAPVPVILKQNVRQVLGGVGNVAANLATLGCQPSVLYAAAPDFEAQQIKQLLADHHVTSYPFTSGLMTTKKQRIIASKQQICRIDSESPLCLTKQQEDKIIYQVKSLLPRMNLILLSDYNKGLITPRVAQGIIHAAKEQDKPVFVDPKGENYEKYRGASLIKPNFNEFKTAVNQLNLGNENLDNLNLQDPSDRQKIEHLASLMSKKLDIPTVIVTLGAHGMLATNEEGSIYCPTTARAVSDVSGSGDTSFAVLGASCISSTSLKNSLDLANVGAGIVVEKPGTATLSALELKQTLHTLFNQDAVKPWNRHTAQSVR